MTSKGPIIFKQARVGLRGRQFGLYKFRTMIVDAEKRKKELLASRVGTTNFLFEVAGNLKTLEQFISASGINCYGLNWTV